MKYSIRKQFALVFGLLMAGTILLCWFINNTFLEKYYLQDKSASMKKAYESLNRAAKEDVLESDSFHIEFQNICGKYNIDYVLLDADSQTLLTSTPEYELLGKRLIGNLLAPEQNHNNEIIETKEKYEIRMVSDDRTKTEFLEMWGVLDNGNLYLFRSPLESIRESVALSNRFLAYIGIVSVVISSIVILFISDRVARPIRELTEISERMSHLDFEAKYTGRSKTEIALLGKNINELSFSLEQTISELKTANVELQKDIEDKTRIDEMRKEFLSNVSHELKTPLALIQGYAEGLKEGISEDTESRDFYCEVIMDESAKMNQIVNKLLTLNRLEFGKETISMTRFDMAALIRSYLQSADVLCRQKEVKVLGPGEKPVYVWADEFLAEEVFGNYFSNALNHVAGDKVIDVKLTPNERAVKISVFNTGEPIPEESLPHIWEKFYKVDKARTREYGGSGIGLSIVKAIMDSLNQNYGVTNYENGVEFWFELEYTGE